MRGWHSGKQGFGVFDLDHQDIRIQILLHPVSVKLWGKKNLVFFFFFLPSPTCLPIVNNLKLRSTKSVGHRLRDRSCGKWRERKKHKSFEHTPEAGRSAIDRSDVFILANRCALCFREVLSLGCEAWSVERAVHGAPPVF